MSEYAGWIDGGATGAEALGKVANKFFMPGTAIILNPASHQVTQRAAGTNMSVDIAPGAGIAALTDYSIPVWSNATVNKTVNAADPTNPRNDIVVRYVSLSSYGPSNNLGALKFMIVSGVAAGSPTDPADATIQAAVGAGNPWQKLARIVLPANATSVVNAYITDLRTPIAFAGSLWGGSSNTKGHAIPNVADDTVALLNASQTFANKTLGAGNTVQSAALSLSKTTDANGWTVYNYGTWKEYLIEKTISAVAAGALGNTGGFSFPVGTTRSSIHISLGVSVQNGSEGLSCGLNTDPSQTSATTGTVFVKNNGAGTTSTIYITVRAIDV